MIKGLCFFLSLAILLGCDKPQTGVGIHSPQGALVQPHGTETHGGDSLVAQAKVLAYRLVVAGVPTGLIRDRIAAMPTFSQHVLSAERLIRREHPRLHWVVNRAHFSSTAGVNHQAELKTVALQMIQEAAAMGGTGSYQEITPALIPFRLETEFIRGKLSAILLSSMAEEILEQVNSCRHFEEENTLPTKRTDEVLTQLATIRKLIHDVPLVAAESRLYDPEFGYELDAVATVKGKRREIRFNVARFAQGEVSVESLQLLALHEYSHFLNLSERDHHYLHTYYAAQCR